MIAVTGVVMVLGMVVGGVGSVGGCGSVVGGVQWVAFKNLGW